MLPIGQSRVQVFCQKKYVGAQVMQKFRPVQVLHGTEHETQVGGVFVVSG